MTCSQDRASRFEREDANPCLGGTHHECIDCGTISVVTLVRI